jgi:hypothetical protein
MSYTVEITTKDFKLEKQIMLQYKGRTRYKKMIGRHYMVTASLFYRKESRSRDVELPKLITQTMSY